MGWWWTRFSNFVGEGDIIKVDESLRRVRKFYQKHKEGLKDFQMFVDYTTGDDAYCGNMKFDFNRVYFVRFHTIDFSGNWSKLISSETLASSTFVKVKNAKLRHLNGMKITRGRISITTFEECLRDPEEFLEEEHDYNDGDYSENSHESEDEYTGSYVKANLKSFDDSEDDGEYSLVEYENNGILDFKTQSSYYGKVTTQEIFANHVHHFLISGLELDRCSKKQKIIQEYFENLETFEERFDYLQKLIRGIFPDEIIEKTKCDCVRGSLIKCEFHDDDPEYTSDNRKITSENTILTETSFVHTDISDNYLFSLKIENQK